MEIEYSFNSILNHLYDDNKMIPEKGKYRRAMIQAFPLRAISKIAVDKASAIKWKIKTG